MNPIKKFFLKPAYQRLSALPVSARDLETMEAQWKFFFILASPRSGTVFLSDMLMDAEKHVHVYHEPVQEDMAAQVMAYYSDDMGYKYLQNFRKKEIYQRIKQFVPGIYGEVNPQLRYHFNALKRAFPEARFLHVVRDGRKVVRSAMSRKTYTLYRPNSMAVHPKAGDPWRGRWSDMERFERICWSWMDDNRRLRQAIGHPIQFEKYLSDFDYFKREIASPLEIEISQEKWSKHINQPRNTTGQFTFPDWDQWTKDQQKSFLSICSEEMVLNGYKI